MEASVQLPLGVFPGEASPLPFSMALVLLVGAGGTGPEDLGLLDMLAKNSGMDFVRVRLEMKASLGLYHSFYSLPPTEAEWKNLRY